MRTAIITDTNSGLSETEAKKYDIKLTLSIDFLSMDRVVS